MTTSTHTTRPARAAPDVQVADLHVADAMGQLRHSTRILTLAILGIIHSPHEIQGRQAGPYTYDIDDDWTQDISSLAFDIVHDLEQILSAMEAGGKS